MEKELIRYLNYGNSVELIYLDGKNNITKRTVKLISLDDEYVSVYCYTRRSPRTFRIENILAVAPIQKRGKTA